jgi:hypothetical protein
VFLQRQGGLGGLDVRAQQVDGRLSVAEQPQGVLLVEFLGGLRQLVERVD